MAWRGLRWGSLALAPDSGQRGEVVAEGGQVGVGVGITGGQGGKARFVGAGRDQVRSPLQHETAQVAERLSSPGRRETVR